MGGVDQLDVVDAGGAGGRGRLLGPGLGVGVAADDVRDGLPGGAALPAHLDAVTGRTGRRPARPGGQPARDRPGRCCRAATPSRSCGRCGARSTRTPHAAGRGLAAAAPPRPAVRPPLERGLPGLGVHPAVVDGVRPGGEQPVQLADVSHVPPPALAGLAGDLDEELLPDNPEKALYLASPLRPAWGGVGELDAEHRAGAQQPRVHERGPVVDVDPPRGHRGWPGRAAARRPGGRCPRRARTGAR